MKKRNLNWLLALLAALALVFAAGCSDGSDDSGGGSGGGSSYTGPFSGTEWKFEGTASEPSGNNETDAGTYLMDVTLEFAETGYTVIGTANWIVRTISDGSGSNTSHSGTFTGTYSGYSYAESALTVTVTLGSGNSAVTLPLTLDTGSYEVSEGVVTFNTFTSTSELTVGTLDSATYTVTCGDADSATVDIFDADSSLKSGEIAAEVDFACQVAAQG